ncbi:MAG: PPC domain-containing protein, partial [Sandaracinaceae bacterium]|nr:PPC domain-containing protein [Sandaracinaceae bacterium]
MTRMVACLFLMAATACGTRPLPSSYAGRDSLGLAHDAEIDSVRHSLDPTRRNTIAFAADVLARGERALAEGDTLAAITRAQEAATAAGVALAARSTRERLRARAWLLESRAWSARGYPGRALIAAALAGLATDYLASEQVAEDDAAYAQTLRQLDAQVRAANEAENRAVAAVFSAVASAAVATANAVSSQMRAQNAAGNGQSQEMQQATQAMAQRAMATSVQAIASAASTTSESAALVSRMDAALQRASADTRATLSLQTPEIATARTPLSQIARFYLEAGEGDGRYLRQLARRLARTERFRPAGLREAVLMLDGVCPAGEESGLPEAPRPAEAPRLIEGTLDGNEDSMRDGGELFDLHSVELEVDDTIAIDLVSEDFDAFLIVRTPDGQRLVNDDRGDGTLHSHLELTAAEAGTFRIQVSTFEEGMQGHYVLRIGPPGV